MNICYRYGAQATCNAGRARLRSCVGLRLIANRVRSMVADGVNTKFIPSTFEKSVSPPPVSPFLFSCENGEARASEGLCRCSAASHGPLVVGA